MVLVDIIAGARPNFMKIAPIIDAIEAAQVKGKPLRYRLIHTGQHYDSAMSGEFFEQLGIPAPHINLEVGSGTQAQQTAAIMVRYEEVLLEKKSSLCLVVGDVTSTMACSITARKLDIPVAHVEGGLRSGDWTMPEEINRVVTDSITNWFFTTSETANVNLVRSGVPNDRIFFVGNTMIDTLYKQLPHIRPPSFWDELCLKPQCYFLVTLHRPANVDSAERLIQLLHAINAAAGNVPVIFPVHPRTAKNLKRIKDQMTGLHYVAPQGYLEFIYLAKNAKGVVTDSGGITEETTVMGVPCLTLRDSTERPETVTMGTNELIGLDLFTLESAMARLIAGQWKKGAIPPKWDGKAARRIVDHLEQLFILGLLK
jgi:UDP-N-acetylglucosamine 2-epimerase (non-hydrolysing)